MERRSKHKVFQWFRLFSHCAYAANLVGKMPRHWPGYSNPLHICELMFRAYNPWRKFPKPYKVGLKEDESFGLGVILRSCNLLSKTCFSFL